MRALLLLVLGSLLTAMDFGVGVPAFSQDKQSPRRSFDYWQPDWMIRDLWGPGKIPKGMMIRLLRHTIYMQYGVPKEYAGASSTASSRTTKGIADGAILYAVKLTT